MDRSEGGEKVAEREVARLSLAASAEYLPAGIGFVRDMAGRIGLGRGEAEALGGAVERVAANVIQHAFDPGEDGSFDIVVRRRPGSIAVAVEDRGLPFDFRPLGDGPESVLGQLAQKGAVDSVHVSNLGVQGNRVELVKRLAPKPAADGTPPAPTPPPAHPDTPITLRLMTPADAEAVIRCTYRTYGYTAPDEKLYDAAHLTELIEGGLYEACVGTTPEGEVVSFIDFELERRDARVANAGEAMVDPRFRGHGLFDKMKRFFRDRAAAKGLLGIYGEAVTVHPYSQKGEIAMGSHELGVHLADEAPRVVFKDIAGGGSTKRTATVLYYTPLNPPPPRVAHPPDRHRDIIRRIYERGAFPRTISTTPTGAVTAASGRIRVDVFPDWSEASIAVEAYGNDLPQLIRTRLRELCVKRIDWIGLDMPLNEPGAADLCPALESLGFFFAAVIPELFGGDVLRLQYLNDIEPDLEPQIVSDFGRELFRYVVDSRPA